MEFTKYCTICSAEFVSTSISQNTCLSCKLDQVLDALKRILARLHA